eukprot:1769235-Pyramimonas_sp.AAC.1
MGVICVGSIGGLTQVLYHIWSGIIPGCSASGASFAWGMDPFMRLFRPLIEAPGHGVSGACADDAG